MAFEATKNFRKKATSDTTGTGSNAASGRFEATSNFRRNEAYAQRRYNEMERQVNDIISRYNGIIKQAQKYTSGGEKKSATPNIRYRAGDTIGVGNDYADFSTAYSLGRSAAKLRKEASELMSAIQDDYGSGNAIEKLAAVQILNSIANESFDDEINNEYIGRMPYTSYNVRKQALRQYLDDKKIEKKYGINDDTSAIELIGKAEGITVPKAAAERQEASADAKKAYSEEKSRIEKEYGIILSYDDYEENVLKLQELMKTLPAGEEKQRVLDFSKIDPTIYNYKMTAGGSDTPTAEEKKKQQKFEATERTGYNYIEADRDTLQKEKDYLRYLASQRITMDDWNAINEGEAYTDDVARDYKVSAIINNAKSKEDFKEKSKIGDEEKESLRFDSSPLSTSETAKKKFFGGGTPDSAFDLSASYDEITNGMSEDEKNVFNYILNTEGKTAATEYRHLLNRDSEFYEDIGSRKGREFYEKNLKGHPILTALYSVPAGFFGQFGSSIQSAGDFALGTTPDPKEHTELSAIEAAKQNHGALYNVLLDLGVNLGDNAPSWIIGGAAGAAAKGFGAAVKTAQDIANTASAGTMFLSAGSAAYTQAIEEGYSSERAQNYGVLTGVSEAFLEKALGGIAGMGGKITGKSVKSAIKNIEKAGRRMLAEGTIDMAGEFTEEYLQEILDPVFRNITLDENNEFKPFTADALYAGMLGALSAATVNAGPLAIEAISYAKNKAQGAAGTVRTGQELIGTEAAQQMVELGKEIGKDRLVEKATADVKERRGLGKIVQFVEKTKKAAANGKLAESVVTDTLRKAESVASEELTQRLGDLGQKKDVVVTMALAMAANDTDTQDAMNALIIQSLSAEEYQKTIAAVGETADVLHKKTNIEQVAKVNDSIDRGDYDMENIPLTSQEIKAVRRDGDGNITYIGGDGQEVSSEDVKISAELKYFYEKYAAKLPEADAEEMITAFKKSKLPDYAAPYFAAEWKNAREMGRLGVSSERLSEVEMNLDLDTITKDYIKKAAYAQGLKERAKAVHLDNVQKKAEKIIQNRRSGKAEGEVRGTDTLHKSQDKRSAKNVLRIAEVLAKLGYDIEFYSGKKTINGVEARDTVNGAYVASTHTVYLRADASYSKRTSVRGILGFTLAHELTHSLKEGDLKGYQELVEYITASLGTKTFENLMSRYMYTQDGKENMKYSAALDEVVANACEKMLENSKALEKLAMENAPLYLKIGEKLKNLIRRIRNSLKGMYSDVDSLHPETAELMKALGDRINEFQQMYDRVLYDSITNMRKALAEAENAKTRENLDVLEKQAEKEGLQLQSDQYLSISFSEEQNNETKYILQSIVDNIAKIPAKKVFTVNGVELQGRATDYVKAVFDEQGNVAHNSVLGDVELGASGAKSTMFHGYGANKLAAVKAIKPTIENGEIISKTENYQNTGVDRYIIAAMGNINGKESYVGVMIKSYPNAKRNSKFYLHEATIIETDPHIMTAVLKSSDTVSESVSKQSISDAEQNVNSKLQNSEEKTNSKFSPSDEAYTAADWRRDAAEAMEFVAKTDTEKAFALMYADAVRTTTEAEAEIKEINAKLREAKKPGATNEQLESIGRLTEQKKQALERNKEAGEKLIVYQKYGTYTKLMARAEKTNMLQESVTSPMYQSYAARRRDAAEAEARRTLLTSITKRSNRIIGLASDNSRTKHIPTTQKELIGRLGLGTEINTLTRTALLADQRERMLVSIADAENRLAKYRDDLKRYTERKNNMLEKLKGNLTEKQRANAESSVEYYEQFEDRRTVQIEAAEKQIENFRKRLESLEASSRAMDEFTKNLYDIYESFKGESDKNGGSNAVYDTDIGEALKEFKDRNSGRSVLEMSTADLRSLDNLLAAVSASITNADRVFKAGRNATVSGYAEQVRGEVGTAEKTVKENRFSQTVYSAGEWIKKQLFKPAERFKQTGSGTLYKMYRRLQHGEGDYARSVIKYGKFFKDQIEKYGIKEADLGKKITETVTDTRYVDGKATKEYKQVTLTVGQIMTMYGLSLRKLGLQHLVAENGGFRLEGKRLLTEKAYIVNAKAFTLDADGVHTLTSRLSNEQKEFVKALQGYMSTEMAKDRNKVTLEMYDYEGATEKNYWPIITDSSYRVKNMEKKNDRSVQLKNIGSMKETNPMATSPVILQSIETLWANHANETALYSSFTLELENIKRVLDYEFENGDAVKRLLGDKQSEGLFDFLKMVNGGIRADDVGMMKLFNLYKAAKVGANLRVVIQQPTAIVRALALIDPKYLFGSFNTSKTLTKNMGMTLEEEAMKYTSTYGIKSLGGIDIGTKGSLSEQLSDFGKNKLTSKKAESFNEKAFYGLAEQADRVTWLNLWNACKREQHDLHPELSDEALLKAAGERFDKITNETQVYDSVFSRARILSSESSYARMLTSFMAEPLTTLNMAIEGVSQIVKGNAKKGARYLASVAGAIILTNMFSSAIDALRDDDDDQSFGEKYVEALLSSLINDFNPAAYIPFYRDLLNIIQGYDAKRADMQLVSDIINRTKTIVAKWDTEKGIRNFAELWQQEVKLGSNILDALGIPMTNIWRDGSALLRLPETLKIKTTKTGWKSAMEDFKTEVPFYGWRKKGMKTEDKLYYATLNKDSAYLERAVGNLTEELEGKGKSKKEIRSAIDQKIKKGLQDNDLRIAAAAQARIEGDTEEYLSCVKAVVNDGFTEKQTVSAILALENELNGDDEGVDRYISGIPYTKTDIQRELEAGNTAPLEEFYAQKFTEKSAEDDVKNPAKEARQAAANMLGNIYSEPYKRAYDDGDTDECERITELLLDVEIEGYRLLKYKTIVGWKDKKLSDDEEEEE